VVPFPQILSETLYKFVLPLQHTFHAPRPSHDPWLYYITLYLVRRNLSFFMWRNGPTRAVASSLSRFLDHTQRCITVGGIPLDEWSTHRRVPYLITRNIHNRQTSMPRRDSNPANERLQAPLDRAANGIGGVLTRREKSILSSHQHTSKHCMFS
jgi:hypothetical protein